MEKITLYDQTNNKTYDIMLSPEDASPATSDIKFATSLLNAAIVDQNRSKQNETILNVSKQSNVMPEDSNIQSTESVEENSLFSWPEACVLLLLRTYEEMEDKFNNGKFSHKKCWELLSQVLKDKGYDVTGTQCSSKFRGLKKTYKSIKDHNSKSGNDRRTWQYFEVMDQMFCKKTWCKPMALASSTGLSIKNKETGESTKNKDTGKSTASLLPLLGVHWDSDDEKTLEEDRLLAKITKTTKTSSVAQLLGKRLAQKEEHEDKKQK